MEHLDADWYNARPIPEKLLEDLGKMPIVSEEILAPVVYEKDIERRRHPELGLTQTEYKVVALASHGLTNQMISDVLEVGIETIKTHIKRSIFHLRAKNRTHMVAIALREGLIE